MTEVRNELYNISAVWVEAAVGLRLVEQLLSSLRAATRKSPRTQLHDHRSAPQRQPNLGLHRSSCRLQQ